MTSSGTLTLATGIGQPLSLRSRQRRYLTESCTSIVNSHQTVPVGTLVSTPWVGTSQPVMDPEGYIGSVTEYWASLEVWSRRFYSTLEAAVIAKYRSHLGSRLGVRSEPRVREWAACAETAIESSSLLVNGKLLFAIELRLDRIDVRAAWLDEIWILVVAIPEDAPEPEIRVTYEKVSGVLPGGPHRLPPLGGSATDGTSSAL